MLYVSESGPDNVPTLVFLHGGGGSGWMWQPQVKRLSDYHCLVPDLPGHGRSLAEGPFAIKLSATMIADLIRTKAHGGRASVVGLSLGGQVAVELLSQSPQLVDHAVISGALLRPVGGIKALAPLMKAILYLYAPFQNRDFWIRANMKTYSIPKEYETEFREDTRLIKPGPLTRLLVESMTYRLPKGLDRVTVPTLVVVGQKERGITYQSARDLVKAIPGAQGRIALKVSHNWSMQAPELFTQMVRAWLKDQPLPDGLRPLSENRLSS